MPKSKETYNKREKEKKRIKQKQEKLEKMQQRKAEEKKGKSLDDMIAYIDEDGNLSVTPPDGKKKKVFNHEELNTGVPVRVEVITEREGTVDFFNDAKGYGFIKDAISGQSIFVHINQVSETIKENDRVSFQTERGPKGINAIAVKKLR